MIDEIVKARLAASTSPLGGIIIAADHLRSRLAMFVGGAQTCTDKERLKHGLETYYNDMSLEMAVIRELMDRL